MSKKGLPIMDHEALLIARDLYAQRYEEKGDFANALDVRNGLWDNVDGYIPWLVKAVERGRLLEREKNRGIFKIIRFFSR